MVDAREELPDVALQNPRGPRMVARNDPHISIELVHCAVCALIETAGIRIEDECFIEIWIQHPINRMMQQSVAHFSLVNIARFRIVDLERMIWAVSVGFILKLAMQRENIAHKIQKKRRHILALPLAAQKFAPRGKQIFHGNDIMVNMARPHLSLSLSLSLSIKPRFSFESKRGICFG